MPFENGIGTYVTIISTLAEFYFDNPEESSHFTTGKTCDRIYWSSESLVLNKVSNPQSGLRSIAIKGGFLYLENDRSACILLLVFI